MLPVAQLPVKLRKQRNVHVQVDWRAQCGFLTTEAFSTEAGYDTLTLGDAQYWHGDRPVVVVKGQTITWSADYYSSRSGFSIEAEWWTPAASKLATRRTKKRECPVCGRRGVHKGGYDRRYDAANSDCFMPAAPSRTERGQHPDEGACAAAIRTARRTRGCTATLPIADAATIELSQRRRVSGKSC